MNPLRAIKNITKQKEDHKMRTLVILIAVTLTIFVTSCSTTYYSSNPPVYDEVYYTAKVVPVATETVVITDYSDNPSYSEEVYGEGEFITEEDLYEMYEPSYEESYSYTDPEGTTYVTNNYYGDYNDYSYTSRIRRFHDPYYSNYYCDYYASPYAYDPYYYGSNWSFSVGFSWGWGSFGYGWGYPYYGYGYPYYGWYDPWYGYPYYGYGSYWAGYWDGYYDGYYGNYPGGYYPEYTSVYYGPRTSREGTNNSGSGGRGDNNGANIANVPSNGLRTGNDQTSSYRSSAITIDNASDRTSVDVNDLNSRSGNAISVEQQSGNSGRVAENQKTSVDLTRPSSNPNETGGTVSRESDQNPVTTRSSGSKPASQINSANNQGNQGTRYTKEVTEQPKVSSQSDQIHEATPQGQTRETYSKPKTYSSPVYTRPKSSQEYKTPASENVRQYSQPDNQRNTYTKPAYVTPRSNTQTPSRSGNVATPSHQPSNTRTYTTPSQPNRSYSAPQRSSSPSYSAPSRSSGSYSAPSRSGGSSGTSGGRR
jgi:hypothetical protein